MNLVKLEGCLWACVRHSLGSWTGSGRIEEHLFTNLRCTTKIYRFDFLLALDRLTFGFTFFRNGVESSVHVRGGVEKH